MELILLGVGSRIEEEKSGDGSKDEGMVLGHKWLNICLDKKRSNDKRTLQAETSYRNKLSDRQYREPRQDNLQKTANFGTPNEPDYQPEQDMNMFDNPMSNESKTVNPISSRKTSNNKQPELKDDNEPKFTNNKPPLNKSNIIPSSKISSKPGSKASSKPGSKPGIKSGSKSDTEPTPNPASKEGSKVGSKPSSRVKEAPMSFANQSSLQLEGESNDSSKYLKPEGESNESPKASRPSTQNASQISRVINPYPSVGAAGALDLPSDFDHMSDGEQKEAEDGNKKPEPEDYQQKPEDINNIQNKEKNQNIDNELENPQPQTSPNAENTPHAQIANGKCLY